MVYGYLRVSSDKQDYNNQKVGVDDLAKRNGWTIDRYILDDGVSGTVAANKRNLGKQLLPHLSEGAAMLIRPRRSRSSYRAAQSKNIRNAYTAFFKIQEYESY